MTDRLEKIKAALQGIPVLPEPETRLPSGAVVSDLQWAVAEIERLQKQLPEGMEHCTIQFKGCEKGHGRLIATNWVDPGCPYCDIESLRNRNFKLRDLLMQWVAGVDRGAAISKRQLMSLLKEELDAQAKEGE